MDEAARIPIALDDLAPQIAVHSSASPQQAESMREDGTLLIDILSKEAARPVTDDQIVVRANRATETSRIEQGADDEPTDLKLQLSETATVAAAAKTAPMPMGGSELRVMATLKISF